ncbi:TetR/AcrR family transcriptional regulator [Lysobacter brunescens]|uniref:TetR/AcrR family transcriptional regulator n=1 Tax=Lysobacter brunescens TaxID=262323 RepID=A0ABW2YKR6_9GAMM
MDAISTTSPVPVPDAGRGAGPGRPKDLGKRAAILDAAKRLFSTHGFDGVSMDQIATDAGVSKLTVYSHFGDKDSLFGAAVRAKCEEQLPPELFLVGLEGNLREQITAIARAFFALVTSEEAVAMHRMMMVPGTGDAHVRELFWQAGPQRVKEGFAAFLRDEVAQGALDIPDIERAASQFLCLLKGELHMQMMCGLCCTLAGEDVEAHIHATVDLFLRAYGTARRQEAGGA